jgi:hypothetical protein
MWKTFDTFLFRIYVYLNYRRVGYKLVLIKNGQTAVYIARPFCGSVIYALYDINDRVLCRRVLSWYDFSCRYKVLLNNGWEKI